MEILKTEFTRNLQQSLYTYGQTSVKITKYPLPTPYCIRLRDRIQTKVNDIVSVFRRSAVGHTTVLFESQTVSGRVEGYRGRETEQYRRRRGVEQDHGGVQQDRHSVQQDHGDVQQDRGDV